MWEWKGSVKRGKVKSHRSGRWLALRKRRKGSSFTTGKKEGMVGTVQGIRDTDKVKHPLERFTFFVTLMCS